MKPDVPWKPTALPFLEERQLTEEQRTQAVRTLLDRGFSVADVWRMAPALLSDEPDVIATLSVPTRNT